MSESVSDAKDAWAKAEAKLKLARRKYLTDLPKKIVANLPERKVSGIRSAIREATQLWKQANSHPDENGYVYVHESLGLLSFPTQKIKLANCEPWKLGVHRGFASPLSVYPELFFDYSKVFESHVKNMMLYEFFAVAIVDQWKVAHIQELSTYHSWMTNSLVDWLIHLRPTGWKGVEPTAAIFYSIHDDRIKREYEKLKEQKEKQIRKTDQSIITSVKEGATALFSKHATWSGTRIAKELKEKDVVGTLPSETQIRTLITTHCPQIPKQKAGRKRGQTKK
ncbi:MAG: hypothetical protein ING73_10495 [Rhodocyclaceae bacterium]|jgi:hypothetical protein|nr:hypothetical protein [Rhodocyclaceae bacterium]MCA3018595.1 hypothetical protein [Rhodocyclaceae bacterium]MCA3022006.1 hypothetical protein [Rhodocyclaceae bacterium]MCA3024909.1 hypothetical protein [Rhodocyclaceae bacterium]MCA3032218.1 hypothetical protein [Rhodocyclaceae bacterium]